MTDIILKQGDTYTSILTVVDENGTAINITGASLIFYLKAPGVSASVLTVLLVLTTPLSGIATLTLTAAQTAALNPDIIYRYEIERIDIVSQVTTAFEGRVFVAKDRG